MKEVDGVQYLEAKDLKGIGIEPALVEICKILEVLIPKRELVESPSGNRVASKYVLQKLKQERGITDNA